MFEEKRKDYEPLALGSFELNQEIVTLGRAGFLGPMTRGEQVNEAALNKPEIWNAFLRFVKPIQLPAEHRGEQWWRYIELLS